MFFVTYAVIYSTLGIVIAVLGGDRQCMCALVWSRMLLQYFVQFVVIVHSVSSSASVSC